MKRLVLILGAYRSGTSILTEAFAPHSPNFERQWPFPDADFRRDVVVMKLPRHFVPSQGLTCNLDRFRRDYAFDRIDVVWCLRHPVDVVLSLRPALEAGADIWPPPPGDDWIERGAAFWNRTNEVGYDTALALANDVRVVQYEDLVRSPRAVLVSLAHYLGREDDLPFPLDLRVADRITDKPGRHEAAIQTHWHQPHERHVDRWKDADDDDVIAIVRRINWWSALARRYSVPPHHL